MEEQNVLSSAASVSMVVLKAYHVLRRIIMCRSQVRIHEAACVTFSTPPINQVTPKFNEGNFRTFVFVSCATASSPGRLYLLSKFLLLHMELVLKPSI